MRLIKFYFSTTYSGYSNSILNYFNCGKFYEKSIARYVVQKTTDINEKIIPFLKKFPLQGSKGLDFSHFMQIAELMKVKAHLTESGLKQVIEIKKGMG